MRLFRHCWGQVQCDSKCIIFGNGFEQIRLATIILENIKLLMNAAVD